MRLLALVTDAYGGRGGIAKFNRDLLASLASHPAVSDVIALPRVVVEAAAGVPEGVQFRTEAAGSKARYARALVGTLAQDNAIDGVVCGHVNLLPFGWLAALRYGAPLLEVVHGIEAWGPPKGALQEQLLRWLAPRVDHWAAVSEVTRRRLTDWLDVDPADVTVVPNCIDAAPFGVAPPRPELVARYGLEGRTVLMTLGRLSAAERYKGFDEVMEALPALLDEFPELAYLICGDGDDRPRLEAKAAALGLADRVVFAGYIPEEEKADHYRLAHAFAMPGRGEGFGIVYLEALACGVPVVASSQDASREAVRDGELGVVVDPDDAAAVREGLAVALRNGTGGEKAVPPGLAYFSQEQFRMRWHRLAEHTFGLPTVGSVAVRAPVQV